MPIEIDGQSYLDTQEALRYLSVSLDTLARYVREGRLHRYKKGIQRKSYYMQSEVEQLARFREKLREELDNSVDKHTQ